MLWCEVQDTGDLVVAQPLVEAFLANTPTCMDAGMNCPYSHLARLTRDQISLGPGLVTLEVRSEVLFRYAKAE